MVIVDTRSASAYEGVHIAGAVSLPLEDMEEPYDGLDGYQEIITYCT
jgi:rhodanese-related sulfurtransferase